MDIAILLERKSERVRMRIKQLVGACHWADSERSDCTHRLLNSGR